MTSADQLEVSPTLMESAATQLGNDAKEATATADMMALIGSSMGEIEVGMSIRAALVDLGAAYSAGFTTVASELTGLGGQVQGSARLAVLVDNNAAGYFTASDAI
ncbi:MAG: hypothetical protein ABWZ02_07080 [Nakamurella sp.]